MFRQEDEPAMRFLNPAFLWVLSAAVLLGASLWIYSGQAFRCRIRLFIGEADGRWEEALKRKRRRLLLMVAALLLFGVALAQPLAGLKGDAAKRQGVNLLIALDGSSSMLTEDVSPNRFGLAQKGIASLVNSFD